LRLWWLRLNTEGENEPRKRKVWVTVISYPGKGLLVEEKNEGRKKYRLREGYIDR